MPWQVCPSTFAVAGSASLAALVAGGGWAAGYVRWQSRARITAQVQAGLEQERTRIAADMHDLVAHTWAVVAAQADGARYALGNGSPDGKAAEALEVIAETARGSIADLRDLLAELRYQAARAHQPLAAPREPLLQRMRASGMDVRVTAVGEPRLRAPGGDCPAAAGRVAHQRPQARRPEPPGRGRGGLAATATVWWCATGCEGRSGPGTGNGLTGMRERVERAGGRFTASADGPDWVLRLEVPAP